MQCVIADLIVVAIDETSCYGHILKRYLESYL